MRTVSFLEETQGLVIESPAALLIFLILLPMARQMCVHKRKKNAGLGKFSENEQNWRVFRGLFQVLRVNYLQLRRALPPPTHLKLRKPPMTQRLQNKIHAPFLLQNPESVQSVLSQEGQDLAGVLGFGGVEGGGGDRPHLLTFTQKE